MRKSEREYEEFEYKVGRRLFKGMREIFHPKPRHYHSHRRENARRRAQLAKGWQLSEEQKHG